MSAPLLRMKEVFLKASELPVEQRASFLDSQTDLTAPMRARVATWLADPDDSDSDRLRSPAAHRFEEADPKSIGPYRVLRRIGSGGMGVVYLAEQGGPVSRQVAIKRIKAGLDSEGLLRRFEAERGALQRMDHPSIAGVFDAGMDERGRPYVVMEYVGGVSLIDFCERSRLDLAARLRLFASVCRGVQHAHHKGVLHRDLKPGNVLVVAVDGEPMPKIIDFGVAKAVEHRLTAETLNTQFGVMIGTPEYMSPEQAGTGDVDTRSDVYSLGVMLYEMLTGALPFAAQELRERGADGIRHVLQHRTPPRPSARAAEAEQGELARRLVGDLDWIAMRAIEKEPDRRYASCSELAADIERHLNDEPVLAGPPTVRYRLQKVLRRYRTQVAAATVVAIALVLGAGVAVQFALDARTSARRLEQSRADLLKERRAVEGVLERASEQVERRLRAGKGALAAAHERTTIGAVYSALGRHGEAADQLGRAVRLLQSVPGASARDTYELMRSALLDQIAQDSFAEREGWLERFGAAARAVLGERHPELSAALQELGPLESPGVEAAVFERAFDAAARCLEPIDPLWTTFADLLTLHLGFAEDRVAIGERVLAIYSEQGLGKADAGWLRARLQLTMQCNHPANARHDLACRYARETLAVVEAELPSGHWFEGVMRFQLGLGLLQLGDLPGADRELRKALRDFDDELGPDGIWALAAVHWLIECRARRGDTDGARRLRSDLVARARRTTLPAYPWLTAAVLRPEFGALADDLAELHACRMDPVAALPRVAAVVESCRALSREDADRAVVAAKLLASIGNDLSNAGAHSAPMRRLFDFVDEVLSATASGRTYDTYWFARHCLLLGDHVAGERVAAAALRDTAADPAHIANLRVMLGLCRFELEVRAGSDRRDEAVDAALAGYRGLVETLGISNGNTNDAFSRIVGVLRRSGHPDRARSLVAERLDALVNDRGDAGALWMLSGALITEFGDEELAAEAIRAMERSFPDDPRTLCRRAQLHASRFDRASALEWLHRAHAAAPDDWLCQSWLAEVFARLGMADEARLHGQRAVQLRSTAGIRNEHAARLFRLGQVEEATSLFEALVSDWPDFAPARVGLAECLQLRGIQDRALAEASVAFDQQPSVGRLALARLRLAQGQPVADVYSACADVVGRPTGSRFWGDYAIAMSRAGRFDEARRRLEQLTREWPSEPHAWAARARALSTTVGAAEIDRVDALAAAERAVDLSDRQGAVMLATLAEAQFRLGNSEAAIDTIRECRRVMRGQNSEWLSLADVKASERRYRGR